MENWLLYVFLGLTLGVVISLIWSEIDRSQAVELNNSRKSYYEKQRQDILEELAKKQLDSSSAKKCAITLLYQFAASKNNFSLKDLELCTEQLQELYKVNLEFEGVFTRNFPEKENLNFEPKQALQLLIIINEGMHNAAIHSQANFIFTILSIESEKLNLITHDNGSGYDRKLIPDGEGIKLIKNATQKLGGDLKLTSTIGNGTVVNVEISISQRDSRQSKTDFINQSTPLSP
ncbi:hypothetical protein LX97_00433 [Nonlabens dokdonensis]|uniref:Uncharacterized protein n=2 Tax=Nonlabens dokdonensis TaxID=328515 RepID=A0ABX5Q090_9FLAO|nr:signal transduction histidine kinase [Nonlabens dokdonensis]AGC75748.1 putative signal transduction histidine kinase [Nonlabens dokdonensis DSW-6]PZX43433.1 hypothetical protein LX97_00433 [Nonlabens dokdonensis]